MKQLDEATLERIIEQITRQVLVLMQDDEAGTGAPAAGPISAKNYLEQVQPVVNAGADRVASTLGIMTTDDSLAHMIDHTVLKPDATQDQIAQLCYEARKHSFASVCINPTNVKLCAQLLKGSGVPVCTVVGFTLGATSTEVKVFEMVPEKKVGRTKNAPKQLSPAEIKKAIGTGTRPIYFIHKKEHRSQKAIRVEKPEVTEAIIGALSD